MCLYGYCRISRKSQNIERQVRNITAAFPAAHIVKEAFTGTKIEGRKELDKLLKVLKAGDTVIFDSASRMSRNEEEAIQLYEELFNKNITLIFLKEPHIRGKYILVYQVHNNPRLDLDAEKVSKDKQLPIVRVSALFHQIIRKGKLVVCPKMGEFLGYIRYAECMITDSFHGTAFALNFNIPFVEVLPNNNTGTRNISILMLTGLSNRILQDENDISLASEEIDFAPVNAILKRER